MHSENKDDTIAHLVAGQFLLWAKKHNKYLVLALRKK
jgi:hypothetical protein